MLSLAFIEQLVSTSRSETKVTQFLNAIPERRHGEVRGRASIP